MLIIKETDCAGDLHPQIQKKNKGEESGMTTDRQEELIRENERLRQNMRIMMAALEGMEEQLLSLIDQISSLTKENGNP